MTEYVSCEPNELRQTSPWITSGIIELMRKFDQAIGIEVGTKEDQWIELDRSEIITMTIEEGTQEVLGFELAIIEPDNRLWLSSSYVVKEARHQGHWRNMACSLIESVRENGELEILYYPAELLFLIPSLISMGFHLDSDQNYVLSLNSTNK